MRLFNLLVHISRLPCEAHPILAGKQRIEFFPVGWRSFCADDAGLGCVVELRFCWIHLAPVSSHILAQRPRENIQIPQTNLKSHVVMVMVMVLVLLNWDSVESILPLSAAISPQNPPAETHRIHKHLIFFLKYTFSCTVLYTRIQLNEIQNIKCACVLKSNYIRSCRKCTITPADQF